LSRLLFSCALVLSLAVPCVGGDCPFANAEQMYWQNEQGFELWNLYRGDLDVLRSGGIYTQTPGSNPIAVREFEQPSREHRPLPLTRQRDESCRRVSRA